LAGSRDEVAATVKELDKLYGVADFTGKGDNGEPVRVSANGRAAFAFPGGTAEIRKPTREELLASVCDWAHIVKGHADCIYMDALVGKVFALPPKELKAAVSRLDAVLAELAAL